MGVDRSRDARRVRTTWAWPSSSKRAQSTAAGRRDAPGRASAGVPRPASDRRVRRASKRAWRTSATSIGLGSRHPGRLQSAPGPAGANRPAWGSPADRPRTGAASIGSDNRLPGLHRGITVVGAGRDSFTSGPAHARAHSSSRSRRPPVFRVDMTRPGGVSPRSHSIQASSSLAGSGADGPCPNLRDMRTELKWRTHTTSARAQARTVYRPQYGERLRPSQRRVPDGAFGWYRGCSAVGLRSPSPHAAHAAHAAGAGTGGHRRTSSRACRPRAPRW